MPNAPMTCRPERSAGRSTRAERRAGLTLVEVIAALVLIGIAIVAAAQLHLLAARQMTVARQEDLAAREAENVMERLSAVPLDRLTDQYARRLTLSDDAMRRLPDARLDVSIDPAGGEGEPRGKRYRVRVRWSQGPERTASVQFLGWKYAREERPQ